MATKPVVSKTVFESLAEQLVNLKEQFPHKLYDYLSNEKGEVVYQKTKKLFLEYVKKLDKYLRTADVKEVDTETMHLPFVMINSAVELEDMETGDMETYSIVSPYEADAFKCRISYFSPMGKSLLLKRVKDEVEVEAPGGNFRYKIISIKPYFESKN